MVNLMSKLNHLPSEHTANLESICNKIIETGKADIIILFGYFAFSHSKIPVNSLYEILVITDHFETREQLSNELAVRFQKNSPPIHGVIETITLFNISVEEGLFYFSDILREGIILYNNEEFELAKPKDLSPLKRRKIAEEDYHQWMAKAKETWKNYQTESSKNNRKGCAFHLNQVAEFCYMAVEMVFSHNYYDEHNIKAQRDRIRAFDKRIHKAFPLDTKSQIEAFEYLSQAYVGAQYMSDSDFPISQKQIDYWAHESGKLIVLADSICKGKIQRLKDVRRKLRESRN